MQQATYHQPLAARLRPQRLDDFFGQSHLLGVGKPLAVALKQQILHSMILWGPPGTGKTTLAQLLASHWRAHFCKLSAVMAGVKEIREIVSQAQAESEPTVLFIDEIHRFNKAQQDAFLPYVENGNIALIGATTENPSFALNNALLSRARVYVLQRLTEAELCDIIQRALLDTEHGLGHLHLTLSSALQQRIALAADGDARACLNYLELLVGVAEAKQQLHAIDDTLVDAVLSGQHAQFDKQGELFYDLISALHKSVRGSDPDAALYWLARMLVAGCDVNYIVRRIVRMASEDIGNADPRALAIALDAWQALERLGSPEGELSVAQAVVYLALAPKSNAVYLAFNQAISDAKHYGTQPVPYHLRNAPTRLMKQLGYGEAYRYAHDEPHAYAAGQRYTPEKLQCDYYHPVPRGLEIKLQEKIAFLRQLDAKRTESTS